MKAKTKSAAKKALKSHVKTTSNKSKNSLKQVKGFNGMFLFSFLVCVAVVILVVFSANLLDGGGFNLSGKTSLIASNDLSNKTCTTCNPVTSNPKDVVKPLFTDVTQAGAFYDAIKFLKDKGLITGNPDGSFKPRDYLNRAQAMAMIVKALNVTIPDEYSKDCFSDVKTEWFAKYVCYGKYRGWISGKGAKFDPEGLVTRAEGWKMVLGAFAIKLDDAFTAAASTGKPEDVKTADWFARYVYTVYNHGWMTPTVPKDGRVFMDRLMTPDAKKDQFGDYKYTHFEPGMWLRKEELAFMLYKVMTESVPTI